MKILAFNEAFWPSHGGVETFLEELYQYLHSQGHEVQIACRTPHKGKNPYPFKVNWEPDRATLDRLVDWCDVLHINAMHVGLLMRARRRGKKVIATYHDVTMICPKGTKMRTDGPCMKRQSPLMCFNCLRSHNEPKVLQRLLRPAIKSMLSGLMHANVVSSPWMLKRYRLMRKVLIPLGVRVSQFVPRDAVGLPESASDPDGLVRVLYVGRVVPEKGTQLLIEALARCRDMGKPFRLIVCGDGSYMPQLKALIEEKQVEGLVDLRGVVRGAALSDVIRGCDLSVVPSLWVECFGISAIEQMASGLPVIASKTGGLGGIVEGVGLVFERGDVDGLVGHLITLRDNPELRQRMGREARAEAENKYRLQRMNESYESLLLKLVGQAKPAGSVHA
ncbi:MAG: glycosyltransferase family 4 protein [Planctomycetota bacterium]